MQRKRIRACLMINDVELSTELTEKLNQEDVFSLFEISLDNFKEEPTFDNLKKIVNNFDALIIDINTFSLSTAQDLLITLKLNPVEKQFRIIILSNIFTWAKTSLPKNQSEDLKQAKEEEDIESEKEKSEEESDSERHEDLEEKPNDENKIFFGEDDYLNRVPNDSLMIAMNLENLFIFLSKQQPFLSVTVICPGIVYGRKASSLNHLFKKGWLHNSTLKVFGKGSNEIPTVHFKDFITHIKLYMLEENTQNKFYAFAVDRNKKRSQKSIVRVIAQAIGTGDISINSNVEEYPAELSDALLLDLRLSSSDVLKKHSLKIKTQEKLNEEDDEEKPPQPPAPIVNYNWYNRQGIVNNIEALKKEFIQLYNLKPLKILVVGCALTGKTTLCNKLSKHFQLPVIKVDEVIKEAIKASTDIGEQIREHLTAKREKMNEDSEKEIIEPKNEDLEELLPSQAIRTLVQKRLLRNDCINKGYVLDGYPVTANDAFGLFKSFFKRTS